MLFILILKKKKLGIYPNMPINGSANAQCGEQETDVTAEKVFSPQNCKIFFFKI